MTQTVPATCVLGPGKTGLAIGYRVLNLDGTTYSAFSTTGVAETAVLGTYRKASGVAVPDAGGYIVWGVVGTDYAEATRDSAVAASVTGDIGGKVLGGGAGVLTGVGVQADMQEMDGSATPVDNLVLSLGSGGLVEKLNTTLELDGAVYRFTLNALEQAPDSGLTAGETGDAVLDETVEGAYTMRQLLRIMLAALAGKSSGGATSTITFRDAADTKNRITATVGGTGNRTAITLDGS